MKLSIAMIVKNEEKFIEKTLIPLKKLQEYIESEIIVVDTGSTDNTVNICKKYTDKIYFHKWNNDFGSMRNISIDYCKGEWILIVDADEVLYDIKKLVNLIQGKELVKFNSALLNLINYKENIELTINSGYVTPILRLFRKNTIKYEGIIHEQPLFKYPAIEADVRFIHYGYNNNDYEAMEYKFKRNLDLLLMELNKNPNNIYINFQIAASYSMHNQLNEALSYIEVAYELAKKEMLRYRYVLDKYCFILYHLEKYEELVDKALEGIEYSKDFLDFYFYLGESYYRLNHLDKAIDAYEGYLKISADFNKNLTITNNTLTVFTRGYRDNVLYNLAICHYKRKNYVKSMNFIKRIKNEFIIKDKVDVLLRIIIEGKLWNEICIIEKYIDRHNYENILLILNREITDEGLEELNKISLKEKLSEIIYWITYFKEKSSLNNESVIQLKDIMLRENKMYTVYIYNILKFDINEVKNFLIYGKEKLQNILIYLCSNYFEFNGFLFEGLEKIALQDLNDILSKTIIENALLLANKLPDEKKKNLFLEYVVDKYKLIINSYKIDFLNNNVQLLPNEDRVIIELKNALELRYKDTKLYIKALKELLNIGSNYVEYIKILSSEASEDILNMEMKALIPNLLANIKNLIAKEEYQSAYNIIEEALSLVKFNIDLMVLKYELLLKFNHDNEAKKCLNMIILYGEKDRVIQLIN